MNVLSTDQRKRVVACLVEGNSLRATVRMTGVHRTTIQKLLVELGEACSAFQDRALRGLKCKRVQCDEAWSFINSKAKNTSPEKRAEGAGDCWTFIGMCADSKLVLSWLVSPVRDSSAAYHFMHDLEARLASRIQLSTDGHKAYLSAVEDAFGCEIDYGMVVKVYGPGEQGPERQYSPAQCNGIIKTVQKGQPAWNHISTSFIERQNLTLRMGNRRFTRLTNGFSKKFANHEAAVALHFMHYNFCRIHQTLRCTPAMEAGVTDHIWTIEEVIGLLD